MGEVRVTKGSNLKVSGGQTEGMIRMSALTDVSDQICGTCTRTRIHYLGFPSEVLTFFH